MRLTPRIVKELAGVGAAFRAVRLHPGPQAVGSASSLLWAGPMAGKGQAGQPFRDRSCYVTLINTKPAPTGCKGVADAAEKASLTITCIVHTSRFRQVPEAKTQTHPHRCTQQTPAKAPIKSGLCLLVPLLFPPLGRC